jgi:glycosyltransferase involved in cell wall biosynthesis
MNQDKLRFLHIAPRYFPSKGGVETHLAAINAILIANGHSISVVTTQQHPEESLREIHDGIEVIRLPIECQNNKWETWQWFWKNRTILQDKKVFVHDVAWQILPLLPQFYKRFCLVFHGWEGIFPVPYKNILQRRFFASMAAYTLHVGAFIEEFYGDQPTEVIYGGVEVPVINKNHSAKKAVADHIKFLFIGRLEKVNELELYLEFFQLLAKKRVNFSVTWIGDGSYRDTCKKFGEVTGMVYDVQNRLSNADFVCANSYLSILEAQAQAKVVLSLYSNPLKESYLKKFPGASAMLIASSADELNLKLTDLLSNKSHLLQLQTAAQKVAETFSWKKVASIYEKIANRF